VKRQFLHRQFQSDNARPSYFALLEFDDPDLPWRYSPTATAGDPQARALTGIPAGQHVAVVGPSGSGKTTLLNLIAGIDHPTSGRVAIGGEEITQMKERELAGWRARHIGLVFQFYNLIPVLTALGKRRTAPAADPAE